MRALKMFVAKMHAKLHYFTSKKTFLFVLIFTIFN